MPVIAAGFSPYLAFRQPIYIIAGFAGIIAMSLMLMQPLLISGTLPLNQGTSRRVHRAVGALILAAILIHVAGLWITSPPDVIDALTFTSPTPFSAWGVIAMWAVFVSALLATLRASRRLRPMSFRKAHIPLALIIVAGSIAHALLIEGTMEIMSKIALSALLALSAANAVLRR